MTHPIMPTDPLAQLVQFALEMTEKAIDPGETVVGRVDAKGNIIHISRYHRKAVVSVIKDNR